MKNYLQIQLNILNSKSILNISLVLSLLFLFSKVSFAQTSFKTQIEAIPDKHSFCQAFSEDFLMEAVTSGGTSPFTYEWTFSWNEDTLRSRIITITPFTSGEVRLKVTDSGRPSKSASAIYEITESDLAVDFSFFKDSLCAETPVQFNANPSGGTPEYIYNWNFGDGNFSSERNPVHSFISSGCTGSTDFQVTLDIHDRDGCFASITKMIHVKKKPHLVFDDSENPFSPFKHCHQIGEDPTFDVVLENNSLNTSCITGYFVDWGDGTEVANATFPLRHTYTEAGAFELIITAESSNDCELSWSKFVYNQSSPAAGLESYGGTEGCAPIEFNFGLVGYENNSIGTTYTWDFGDGTDTIVWDHDDPFNNDTIKHLYQRTSCIYGSPNGDFITVVTVNNGCGEVKAQVDGVRVWLTPEAEIGNGGVLIDSICSTEEINLYNKSTYGYYGSDCSSHTLYKWNFDDGTFSDRLNIYDKSWDIPGVYNVSLDAINPCGVSTDTYKIVVMDPPIADATVNATEGCAPFTPIFENNSTGDAVKYSWEVSPAKGWNYINDTKNSSQEPEISFNEKGDYRVVLYAYNACDQMDSVVFNFEVFDKPAGRIEKLYDVCITNPVIHPVASYKTNGQPITEFRWIFRGGEPETAYTEDPGEHTYFSVGRKNVQLQLTNECGSTLLSNVFFVREEPGITLDTAISVCESEKIHITETGISHVSSFKWHSLGDGRFDDPSLLDPVYIPGKEDIMNSGTRLLFVAEGQAPCGIDTTHLSIEIQREPIVEVDEDVIICESNQYQVKNAIAENYDSLEWSTSGDGSFSDPRSLLPIYIAGSNDILNGKVELSLNVWSIAPCNSRVTENFTITYAPTPDIDAGQDMDICQNGDRQLQATGSHYNALNWTLVDGEGTFNNSSILDPVFTLNPDFSGGFVELAIEAEGGYGCPTVYDTIKLSVIPNPVVFAGTDGIVCESGSFQISDAHAEEYFDFTWSLNGDGSLDDITTLNPVYNPGNGDIASGEVTLILTAEGNSICPDVSDEITIDIQKLPESFAGDDQDVCKVNNYITNGEYNNGVFYNWYSLGTGTFEDESNLISTYYPSDEDKAIGEVELVLRVDPLGPCTTSDRDTVTLTFIDLPVVFAGNDTTICASSFVPDNAEVFNSADYTWSSDGFGYWQDEKTLTPGYFPSDSDIEGKNVLLTLTSTNPTCPAVSDDLRLTLTPFPESDAGFDDIICEDDVKNLEGTHAANYSSLQWKTSGDGNFDNDASLNPVYIPGENDIENGNVKLFLLANGNLPCNYHEMDSMTLNIQKNPYVFTGADTVIGEGEVFTSVNARASDVGNISWLSLGDGDFIVSSSVISTYQPGEQDIANRGVHLVLRGSSINPCFREAEDTIFLMIVPRPSADAGEDITICEGSEVDVSSASADEYSEIFWTSNGTGSLINETSLSPAYIPSEQDIENRQVMLTLHVKGNKPIEDYIASDNMVIDIIHNAEVTLQPLDTACENIDYMIRGVSYNYANTVNWSTSGDGNFSSVEALNPWYSFSSNDSRKDSIYFFLEVNSILPCTHVEHDTILIRLYHEPEPAFTQDKTEGCSPLYVTFTNNSTGEDAEFHWDFGNGKESFDTDPGTILYEQAWISDTTYPVKLEVSNRCNTVTESRYVIVKPKPIADFGMNVAWGCSPKEILFSNVTTGQPEIHRWNWGDGSPGSMEEEPGSHIFETGDYDTSFTVSLVAENACGIDSMEKTVRIFPNTVDAFFETDTLIGCAPFKVEFRNYSRGVLGDEPFLNWSWNFGDGNVSDERHPIHVFEEPGIYPVTLYVNDTCSYGSFTTEVNVLGAPKAAFETDKTEYCEHDSVFVSPLNMNLEEIASVNWDFGDQTMGSHFEDGHTYDMPGEYTIVMTVKDIFNGCRSKVSRDIIVHEAPKPEFSIPENDACQPLQITFANKTMGADYYSWDFGNGNRSIEVDGQQLFKEPGTYIISLKASNEKGCSETVSHKLRVNPKPLADFESSSVLTCFPPVNVEFTNLSKGADDYVWNFGNDHVSKQTDPIIDYSDYGDYPIQLVASNMYYCSDTAEMVYHVFLNPVAEFTVDTAIGCDPFSVSFKNLSEHGQEYYWQFDGQGISREEEPVFSFEGEGVYSVGLKVIGEGGCHDSLWVEDLIITHPSPLSDFEYTRINEIDTVQFHNFSSGAISYLWDFGDDQFSEEENPWHKYNNYGTYNVSLTAVNQYNCKNTKIDSINFELFKGLFVPTAFSPGNVSDEVREFKAVGIGLVKFHLVIYDTWGNLLWETTKLDRGVPVESWDGTYKGHPLPPDVYVWHIKEALFKDGKSYEGQRYGTVTLIK